MENVTSLTRFSNNTKQIAGTARSSWHPFLCFIIIINNFLQYINLSVTWFYESKITLISYFNIIRKQCFAYDDLFKTKINDRSTIYHSLR